MNKRFAHTVALAASLLGAGPALGDGEARFGSQWWDQSHPDAKFQEFRQVPRGGFLEQFALADWSGRNAFWLYGANALRDDQAYGLTWANGVRWRADLGYSQIPHAFSLVARTPYTEKAPGVFVLPDTLQRTNQENPGSYTSTMNDLLAAAPRIPLGFRTDIAQARLRARPARGWQLEVRGTRRERAGNKPYGAPFGFNSAVELVEPIQQRMVDADAIASYARDRVSVQGSVGLSQFDNQVGTLRWDNPKRLTDRTSATAYSAGDGSAAGQLDLYPDNRAVRGNLALALRLPRQTALSASIGLTRFTQDDAWLPTTINSAIPQSSLDSLPGNNTDAEATRLTQDYRLSARPWRGLSGTLRLRHDRYDNDTPEYLFSGRVRLDQTFIAEPGGNHAFGNEQLVWGADLDYDVVRQVRIGGTYEHRRREHTHREVEEDAENVLGARARVRPLAGVEVLLDYRRGDREMDAFHLDEYRKNQDPDSVLLEQPDLRRYDVADRRQDWARAGVSLPVGDLIEVYAGYTLLRNDYDATKLGLQEETQHTVTAHAMVALAENLDLTAGYGFDQIETEQQSRESAGVLSSADTTNWQAKPKDKGNYAFATVEWRAMPERLSVAASYELSETKGDLPLTNFKGTAVSLPGTLFRRHDLLIEARWRLQAQSDVALRYGFEQYDVTDFASENVPLLSPVTGASNAIYLGDSSLDYQAHRVALVATRRF